MILKEIRELIPIKKLFKRPFTFDKIFLLFGLTVIILNFLISNYISCKAGNEDSIDDEKYIIKKSYIYTLVNTVKCGFLIKLFSQRIQPILMMYIIYPMMLTIALREICMKYNIIGNDNVEFLQNIYYIVMVIINNFKQINLMKKNIICWLHNFHHQGL
jgi:hypothetical protein